MEQELEIFFLKSSSLGNLMRVVNKIIRIVMDNPD